jgi:hypothetical protein
LLSPANNVYQRSPAKIYRNVLRATPFQQDPVGLKPAADVKYAKGIAREIAQPLPKQFPALSQNEPAGVGE